MISRRSFLTRSGAAAAVAGVAGAPHIARSAETLLRQPGQKPGKIIHIVSDGMSTGTLTCADHFSQAKRQRQLSWMRLYSEPGSHHGLMNTRSLNSLVTDSAAASSAWGSGSRVANGVLNVLPNGKLLTPLYELFGQKGWARGLVTTAEITHATPAGFAVAVKNRGSSDDIAVAYLEGKVEVLLGGGRPFFSPNARKDKRDVRGEFAKAGYEYVRERDALLKAAVDKPILGTFADGHLPYTLDHMNDPKLKASTPTLAEMTKAALQRLERHENFILQVEGARIDHAAHNSDAAAAIWDQIALDEAIDVCLEFQKKHPDTLVVITTDHANSNLGLNGMGSSYRQSSQRFAALGGIRMSFPEILKRLQKIGKKVKVPEIPSDKEDRLNVPNPMKPEAAKSGPEDDKPAFAGEVKLVSALEVDPKEIIDIIADATGYKMSERRAKLFGKVMGGQYQALYDQMNSTVTQLGQLVANHIGIGWTGNTHTGDYCPIVAFGPGSEHFGKFINNVDVFSIYTQLAGIDFQNPTVPLIADAEPAVDVEGIEQYALA